MESAKDSRVVELFVVARRLPPSERDAYLRTACAGDGELHAAVASWIRDESAAGDFLESPILRLDSRQWPIADGAAPPSEPAWAGVSIGARLGRYRIERVIGEGGMGIVFEASQDVPRRTVALKVLKAVYASAASVRRFADEAQILARLHHPGVAQVYDAGELAIEGSDLVAAPTVPYLAVEYIANARSITEFCAANELGIQARVELFAAACDAVHHAHQRGVIHRDLKPANILVDAGGQPKVIDFGIARLTEPVGERTASTSPGQLIGTLQYMSPEQCGDDLGDVDVRTDVYSLGVVLYELLCGRPPVAIADLPVHAAVHALAETPPPRPSSVNAIVEGDLEIVVLHALEKNRSRRYQSAAELAADLRRWLAREPITARRPSASYRLSMFARRNRLLASAIASAAIVVVAALVALTAMWRSSEAARIETEAMREDLSISMRSLNRYVVRTGGDRLGAVRSGLFVGPLSRDERAAHGYNTILCIPTGPGSESPIVLLDGDAFEVGRDDLDLTVPSDVSGAPLGTMRFRLIKAVLDDLLPEHPGRELAVALVPVGDASAPNTISVIRMYDLDLQPVAEMWTRGSIDSLVWDAASRQVLIGLSDAVRLQTWHPDLVAYDAMWCVDSARLAAVIAIPPEEVRGMLIANSPGVPVASPSWVIVRAPDDLAAPTSDDLVRWMTIREPISSIPGAVCLIEAEIGPGRSPGAAPGGPRAMAWAHLGSDGRLLEPFACDDPTRAAAAPRVLGRFIRLDLGLLAQMEPLAQQWAKAAVDWEEGRRLIGGHAPMTAEESEAAESLARAMTTNWRWLNNASCAITEHPDRGWRAGDYERALHWAERGVQIHDSRCPNPAECDSSWVIRNTLGLARYRTGSYSEALASFAACERAWTRTRDPEVDPDTLNIALQAMCLQRLGRRAEAAAELERARQSFTRCVSYRDLAEAAVREAEAVVGG